MKERIEKYHHNIINLIDSIAVSRDRGEKVTVYEGIAAACNTVKEQSLDDGKIIFIGNGGSAAICSHMATDFWKVGNVPAMAFNDSSLLTCISNDFGYCHVFEKPIEMFAAAGDVLIAISSSGSSENILRGVETARAKGCEIITLSGFKSDNPLRSSGSINFHVPSLEYGPVEIVHQYICHWMLDMLVTIGAEDRAEG